MSMSARMHSGRGCLCALCVAWVTTWWSSRIFPMKGEVPDAGTTWRGNPARRRSNGCDRNRSPASGRAGVTAHDRRRASGRGQGAARWNTASSAGSLLLAGLDVEAVQHPVKDRRQHEARGDDDDEPGENCVASGEILPAVVCSSPTGPMPERIMAAFTNVSTTDIPSVSV